MLGTMVLILFGNGVDCQVVLGGSTKVVPGAKGDYLSLNFGWAIGERRIPPQLVVIANTVAGAALGVWVSGGISGGHINPVVRLCQSWRLSPSPTLRADMMRTGDHLLSYLPSIPMEEGSTVHSWSGLGRILR
jgi:hypothetical protein